jgi:Flagellar biogenesis protein
MMFRPSLFIVFAIIAISTTKIAYTQTQPWPNSNPATQYQAPPWNAAGSTTPDRLKIKPVDGDVLKTDGSASKSRAPGSTMSVAWTLGCLAFICAFMIVGARLFKKKMGISSQALPVEVLNLLGRKQLTPTQQIYLVRLGPKVVMIGAGPDGLRTLSEITDPVEVDLMTGLCLQKDEPTSPQQFLRLFQKSQNTTLTPTPEPEAHDPYDRLRENLDYQRQSGKRGSYEA